MKKKKFLLTKTKEKTKVSFLTGITVIVAVIGLSFLFLAMAISQPNFNITASVNAQQLSNEAKRAQVSFNLAKANADLLNAGLDYRNAQDKTKPEQALLAIAKQRQIQMQSAMTDNPQLVVENALPAGIRANLPPAVLDVLEKPVHLRGKLEVIIGDDFIHSKSETRHFLNDQLSGQRYELHLAKLTGQELTGATAELDGVAFGTEVAATEVNVATTVSAALLPDATVMRKAVIIVANFQDKSAPMTVAQAAANMYSTTAKSVDGDYRETSYNQLGWNPDTNGDGQPDVYGPYTIPYTSTSACDYYAWATAAKSLATSAGVNLSLYQHLVYIMPANSCGYGGVANVGCGTQCQAWIFYNYADMMAHELGHNLGMGHAMVDLNNNGIIDSTQSEQYGDYSDFMGYGAVGLRQVNERHKIYENWLPASSEKITTINAAGTYNLTLSASELDPVNTTYPQAVKVIVANGDPYYLSYRAPIGYDSILRTQYLNGLSIHRSNGYATILVNSGKALVDGGSLTDAVNSLQVSQISHTAGTEPTVQFTVSLGVSIPCAPANPAVTLSPTSFVGALGTTTPLTITVTNNDGPTCADATFKITPTLPAGFSQLPSSTSLNIAPGAKASVTVSVTTGNTVGNYTVKETAANANNSAYTASASATFALKDYSDFTPPTVTITKPANNSTFPKGKLNISATASDASGIGSITIVLDGTKTLATCTATTCNANLSSSSVTAGSHTITATAVDASPNKNSATASITVNK